jgi:acyl carrier protein
MNNTEDEILEAFTPVFRKVFMVADLMIHRELNASHIEKWDSLTHMILITEIENLFSIRFSLMDLVSMNNVGEMAKMVMKKLQ